MLRRCTRHLIDSFKQARRDLAPLFTSSGSKYATSRPYASSSTASSAAAAAATKTPEQIKREVRHYLLSLPGRVRRQARAQQRSWIRGNLSLLLQEARRRKNAQVATTALTVALEEAKGAVATVEPAWVMDAVGACTSTAELQRLEAALLSFPQFSSPTAAVGKDDTKHSGVLLAALLGKSSSQWDRAAVQLGDDTASAQAVMMAAAGDGEGDTSVDRSGSALLHNCNTSATSEGGGSLLRHASAGGAEEETEEARVINALAQDPPQPSGSLLLRPERRTQQALHILRSQRDSAVVAPNLSFMRYFMTQGVVRGGEVEVMALFQALRSRPSELGVRVHLSHPLGPAAVKVLLGREGLCPVSWLPASVGAFVLQCGADVSFDVLQANQVLLRTLAKEGVLAFQSVSSMLPVHLLEPRRGERVLDMCASPGSKSALILDYMRAPDQPGRLTRYAGCVIANEAKESRAKKLQSRVRGLSPQVVVTCMRGESFGLGEDGAVATAAAFAEGEHAEVEGSYDKVLVDAPCSGEGRLGRDVMAWRLWHPRKGVEFFPRQVALLRRAVRLCAAGGTVVYATCTLNPLENEAVVAAVLREARGSVELVAPAPLRGCTLAESLPSGGGIYQNAVAASSSSSLADGGGAAAPLYLSKALSTWCVPSRSGGFYQTVREARAQGEFEDQLPASLFAPGCQGDHDEDAGAAAATTEVGSDLETGIARQLHACARRVLPHKNSDAEGFFVALLRKTRLMPVPLLPIASSASTLLPRSAIPPPSVSTTLGSPLSWRRMSTVPGGNSLFHHEGMCRLPATNPTLRTLLEPFFASARATSTAVHDSDACGSVSDFLARSGLAAVWKEGEGLRFVSEAALGASRSLSSTPAGMTARLLDLGIVGFDATGSLTADGACVLSPYASRRVLHLPLPYFQVLLSNQKLEIGPELAHSALEGSSNERLRRLRGSQRQGFVPEWASAVLSELGETGAAAAAAAAGNAIVTVIPSTFSSAVPGLGAGHGLHDILGGWTVPVRVEAVSTAASSSFQATTLTSSTVAASAVERVQLHLTLPSQLRHRCVAMLNRVRSSQRKLGTRTNVQQLLRSAELYTASEEMDLSVLYGTPTTSAQQQRALFPPPSSSTKVGPSTSDIFEL